MSKPRLTLTFPATARTVLRKWLYWVEKLGNQYEDTMQDPLTGEFYTMEKYQKVLAAASYNPARYLGDTGLDIDDHPDH